jgi:hypothetical protein
MGGGVSASSPGFERVSAEIESRIATASQFSTLC